MATAAPAPARPSLTLTRRIKAAPAKVFRAWIDPEILARWWQPGGATLLAAEIDARVGGRYRIVARTPDGEEHDVRGVYQEVVPDRRLVFTWAWRSTPERESLVTVELAAEGADTLLTLTHERFFDAAARDRHRGGWESVLGRLEAAFA